MIRPKRPPQHVIDAKHEAHRVRCQSYQQKLLTRITNINIGNVTMYSSLSRYINTYLDMVNIFVRAFEQKHLNGLKMNCSVTERYWFVNVVLSVINNSNPVKTIRYLHGNESKQCMTKYTVIMRDINNWKHD